MKRTPRMLHRCFFWEALEERAMLASFSSFPQPDGYIAYPYDLSGNGSYVVGEARSIMGFDQRAFRWSLENGFELFETDERCTNIFGGADPSTAMQASQNGDRVLGEFRFDTGRVFPSSCEIHEVVNWGPAESARIPIPQTSILASAISGNGRVLIGHNGNGTLLRWNIDLETVETLGTGVGFSPSIFTSSDGSVVAGNGGDFRGHQPFRWTRADGFTALSGLEEVRGISADGQVIIGETSSPQRFPWPALWKNGASQTFEAPQFINGTFNAVSADGSLLGGVFTDGATVWVDGEPATVQSLLESQGVDLGGWRLDSVEDLSDDGTILFGYGYSPEGNFGNWIAELEFVTQDIDLAIDYAELTDSTELMAAFIVDGDVDSFPVAVYRSTDEVFDQTDQLIGASQTVLRPRPVDAVFSAQVQLNTPLIRDNQYLYALVVVDPPTVAGEAGIFVETDETNNVFALHISTVQEGIDRWWGTAGSEESFPVTWIAYVEDTGSYSLSIRRTGTAWSMSPDAEVQTNGSNFALNASPAGYVTTLGNLNRGFHVFRLKDFVAPTNVVVDELTFTLGGFGNERVELKTLFIADHDEAAIPLSDDEKRVLVRRFAPILHFNEGERFPFPFDAETNGWNIREIDARPLVTGSSEDYIQLLRFAPDPPRIYSPNATTPARLYASIVSHSADSGQIAVNYYFFYPRSDWGDHPPHPNLRNTHEGDWEGMTVFLQKQSNEWTATDVGLSQHVGGKASNWERLWTTRDERCCQPHVFVGLGGHATYAFAKETFTGLGLEHHFGQTQFPADNSSFSSLVSYLPRVTDESPEWLRYPGRWGNIEVNIPGQRGPRGPAFLGEGTPDGQRWLNPWEWLASLDVGMSDFSSGDFNGDRLIDIADLLMVGYAARLHPDDLRFDLDRNGTVNGDDEIFWAVEFKNTYPGDTNLSGEFDTSDLVAVFQAGEYEDNIVGNSSWETGDWNGDGEFDSGDLVMAFQFGGFEKGPRPA